MGRAERIEIAATQALANLTERGHVANCALGHGGCQQCHIARTLAAALDAEHATVDRWAAR